MRRWLHDSGYVWKPRRDQSYCMSEFTEDDRFMREAIKRMTKLRPSGRWVRESTGYVLPCDVDLPEEVVMWYEGLVVSIWELLYEGAEKLKLPRD